MTYWYTHRVMYLSIIFREVSYSRWQLTQMPTTGQHAEYEGL